ncbi:MAG: hypothetical protein IPN33_25700 [Saprospiraceae bacterium]|nr:hypothetical protein [Saprospiraceae bacterium]
MKLTAAKLATIQDTVTYLCNEVTYLTSQNERQQREEIQYRLHCIADSFSDFTVMSPKVRARMASTKDICIRFANKKLPV